MIITRPGTIAHSGLERTLTSQKASLGLKPGQIINAVALSNSNRGHVELRIGNTVLSATTRIALTQNSRLSLEVVQTRPQLLLRALSATAGTATPRIQQATMIPLLARQGGLAPSLSGLIKSSIAEGRSLQQQAMLQLRVALANALPERQSLTHDDGMRRAMLQSGLFLEAGLARKTRVDTSRDIKACLLRLQQGLADCGQRATTGSHVDATAVTPVFSSVRPPQRKGLPTPQQRAALAKTTDEADTNAGIPDLSRTARSALARLKLLQIITAENFSNGEYMWQLEIPVKHEDAVEIVSMSIQRERKSGFSEQDMPWIVNLAADLPELGPVQIRISLFGEGVTSCFWVECERTRGLIENSFERLQTALEQRGIATLNLVCQTGSPVADTGSDSDGRNLDLLA